MIVKGVAQVQQSVKVHQSQRAQDIAQLQQARQQSKAENISRIVAQIQAVLDVKGPEDSFQSEYEVFQSFLDEIGYEGKAIAELNKEEASELVSENGFFGVSQTSERIAQFVINGANTDETLLREGKKGILEGFKQAEALWGGKLPEIAYESIDKAVEMIDKALVESGFSIVDEKA